MICSTANQNTFRFGKIHRLVAEPHRDGSVDLALFGAVPASRRFRQGPNIQRHLNFMRQSQQSRLRHSHHEFR